MIASMTGFGKAVKEWQDKKFTVEAKSLNSKQMDLSIKMPGMYKSKELEVRSKVSKWLGRGKIEVSLFVENNREDSPYTLNRELAEKYYRELNDLSESIGASSADPMGLVMKMPDVLKQERQELDQSEWDAIMEVIEEAIGELKGFRQKEGQSLYEDFKMRINSITSLLEKVLEFEPERMETVRQRINKNLEEWVGSDQVDQNRLEQELVYYLEKLDITEEKVRLTTHCNYFLETLDQANGSQGKKLGFISQEIGREINTIGSKANHAGIQKVVVQMKDELEKIKEQVLNAL